MGWLTLWNIHSSSLSVICTLAIHIQWQFIHNSGGSIFVIMYRLPWHTKAYIVWELASVQKAYLLLSEPGLPHRIWVSSYHGECTRSLQVRHLAYNVANAFATLCGCLWLMYYPGKYFKCFFFFFSRDIYNNTCSSEYRMAL